MLSAVFDAPPAGWGLSPANAGLAGVDTNADVTIAGAGAGVEDATGTVNPKPPTVAAAGVGFASTSRFACLGILVSTLGTAEAFFASSDDFGK